MVHKLTRCAGAAAAAVVLFAAPARAHELQVILHANCACTYDVLATGNTDVNTSVKIHLEFTVVEDGTQTAVSKDILTNSDANGNFSVEVDGIALPGSCAGKTVEFIGGSATLTFNGNTELFPLFPPPNLGFCGAPPPPPGFCPVRVGDPFGLKSSGAYTVLGKSFANIIFGSGETLITGDVGVGPHDTGSLEKATIEGTLFLDPTANPSIHGDLVVTGGIVAKDLTAAVNDADAANDANAAKPATQGAVSFPDVGSTTIVLANPSGPNVVPVTSLNTHGMIVIVGDATASVVFNVTGGFTCNGCSIVLASTTQGGHPILPQNVLWNFIGAGGDVSISKPVGSAQGIFLAPGRNLLLDKAAVTGALIGAEGGLKLLVHSGARLTCPQ